MVKSHRSTLTLFHQWPQSPPESRPTSVAPGSPSQLDPFGTSVIFPEPVSRSRPASTAIASSTPLSSGGTTPRIILASPSSSTIHYLFPSLDTRPSIANQPTEVKVARSRSIKQRPDFVHRGSYEQTDKERSADRKILRDDFPLPPSRSTDSMNPFGTVERYNISRQIPASVTSMRTLRRQPSMADLGKGRGLQVEVEKRPILEDIYNQEEVISPKTTKPTPIYIRRRSHSLSTPPLDVSPVLPPPDFGDPISLADVIQSPSFSHLDYSTAGSNAPSRRNSLATSIFSKYAPAIFPSSAAMTRGDTRKGLGSYDAGRTKAREDAARRLNGEGLIGTIRRTVSVKKDKLRPRSQSLNAKSVRDMGISPPVPKRSPLRNSPRRPSDPTRGILLGDLSVDVGGRYTPTMPSPSSIDTSVYPASTPSSGVSSLPFETRACGKPLHPAFGSEISLLAPSSIGLGFSPLSSPASLPSSLEAEAIDLTERRQDANRVGGVCPLGDSPPAARQSTLLSRNTFYIPPLDRKPSLQGKSIVKSELRSATTLANIAAHAPRQKETTPRTRPRRPVTTFSLCSPPDAIEPLPALDLPETEPRLRTKQSSPFLSASQSLRVIFGKKGFVARSLSQAFDKPLPEQPESALKSKISAPLSTRNIDQQWRESVLNQAVSMSMSSSMNKLDGARRPAIPAQLLAAAPVTDRRLSGADTRIGEAMLKSHVNSIDSGLNLRQESGPFVAPADAPAVPSFREEAPPSPQLVSRWSTSPGKARPIISPPMPCVDAPSPSRLALEPRRAAPMPSRSSTIRSSSSRLFHFGRKSPASPGSLTSPSTFSLSLLKSPTSPKSGRVLDPCLLPISSESLHSSRALLDELTARDHDADRDRGKEEKVKKVLDWRDGVGENEEIRKLEEKWRMHMEEEREKFKGIAERESPVKVGPRGKGLRV